MVQTNFLKPKFEILPENIFFLETILLCEISLQSFSCVFQNDLNKQISGLLSYTFDEVNVSNIPEVLDKIFTSQPLFHKKYKKVFISWSDSQTILLPNELFKPGENELLLNRFFGDIIEAIILNDRIVSKRMYIVYRMPTGIHQSLTDQFPNAILNHQTTFLINQFSHTSNLFNAIFYQNKFIIILVVKGIIQIIQSYSYTSDEDAIFYLLKAKEQFNSQNILLQISGVIEKKSELCRKLNTYFPDVDYLETQHGQGSSHSLKELPSHYFSHLFSLASCVS